MRQVLLDLHILHILHDPISVKEHEVSESDPASFIRWEYRTYSVEPTG
jgi:hypothetical protein